MGAIVIRTRFDEGTESAEAATSAWVLQVRRAEVVTKWSTGYNFTFEYSSNNNIFSFVAMSADSVPSSKTNIFHTKLYTLIYCRHFRTYSRCTMFDWSDTVTRFDEGTESAEAATSAWVLQVRRAEVVTKWSTGFRTWTPILRKLITYC
jgi:hypothetical protein